MSEARAATSLTETLDELQRNDPSVTQVSIFLFSPRIAGPYGTTTRAAIAQALETNTYIQSVSLVYSPKWTRLEQWTALFRVIRSSNKISSIILTDAAKILIEGEEVEADHRENIVPLTRTILREIQGISALENLTLFAFAVPLDALSSFIDVAPSNFKILLFHGFLDVEPATAIGISPFAAAMNNRNSTHPLLWRLPGTESVVTLLENLVAKKVSLNATFVNFQVDSGIVEEACLPRILRTASQLNVCELCLSKVQSHQVFNQIVDALPSFTSKGLILSLERQIGEGGSISDLKSNLLGALKCNFCLREVVVQFTGPDGDEIQFWENSEIERINFYMNRNKLLSQWIDNPQSVPKHLWPKVLVLARQAGHESLYKSLHSIAEELGKAKPYRKRQRQSVLDMFPSKHHCSIS